MSQDIVQADTPKSGKATASLILGLCSVFLCVNIFAGIPAIVLGISDYCAKCGFQHVFYLILGNRRGHEQAAKKFDGSRNPNLAHRVQAPRQACRMSTR